MQLAKYSSGFLFNFEIAWEETLSPERKCPHFTNKFIAIELLANYVKNLFCVLMTIVCSLAVILKAVYVGREKVDLFSVVSVLVFTGEGPLFPKAKPASLIIIRV